MAKITSKNTKPELQIRRLLHGLGYRYRLHSKSLPGHPDLWLARHRIALFVHGCFWHRHQCEIFRWPNQNAEFWQNKLNRNAELDIKHQQDLLTKGVRVLIVWECSLKGKGKLKQELLSAEIISWIKSNLDFGTIQGVFR